MLEDLTTKGFAGPLRLMSARQCRQLLAALATAPAPMDWYKGRAASDPDLWPLVTDERLLAPVRAVLGPDVLLWGANLIDRAPGEAHRWHTDVESADPGGGFVSAWIGLEGTTAESALSFIAGSHRAGASLQQAAAEARAPRDPQALLALARARVPEAALEHPPVADGEAILFDGRTWHGSRNMGSARRRALLLQYARADRPVRIPIAFDWPPAFRNEPPPCLLVSGSAAGSPNRIVAAPRPGVGTLGDAAHEFALPLVAPLDAPFRSVDFFRGSTPVVRDMESHASILAPGESPHPPHAHGEEELLVVLDGEAELVLPDRPDDPDPPRRRLAAGGFAYYPARRPHTLVNPGDVPVSYLMFKWRGRLTWQGRTLATRIVDCREALARAPGEGFSARGAMVGRTGWLGKLKAHVSVVPPGAGYGAHADAHDVAILLFEGAVETLGRTLAAPAMLFHPAGRPHGLTATGERPARYLVFEFHRETKFDWRRIPAGLARRARALWERAG